MNVKELINSQDFREYLMGFGEIEEVTTDTTCVFLP